MKRIIASSMATFCSFCGTAQTHVKQLIAGPILTGTIEQVFICNECIDTAHAIVHGNN